MDLATSLRVLRSVRGWQGKQLAQAAGVCRSSLSEYETGAITPAWATLCRLIAAMGYSLADLDEVSALIERLRAGTSAAGEPPAAPPFLGLLATLAEDFEGSIARALRQATRKGAAQ